MILFGIKKMTRLDTGLGWQALDSLLKQQTYGSINVEDPWYPTSTFYLLHTVSKKKMSA
jgi:hypothetical protein